MLVALLALLSTAEAAERPALAAGWTVVLPLGGPQFAEGRRRQGLVFGGAQLAAGALTATSLVQMRALAGTGDIEAELRWRMISAGATATTAGFWFGSTLEASRYRQVQLEQLAQAGQAWQLARLGS